MKFNHEAAYRGKDIVKSRAQKQIVICGCGALGANLSIQLAKQGFINQVLVDMDRVEEDNLSTQPWGRPLIGKLKTAALQTLLHRDLSVIVKDTFSRKLERESDAKKLFAKADLVVDVFDNWAARKLVFDTVNSTSCVHAGMSDDGFSEVKWNENYKIPQVEVKQDDICDYPLAVNLVQTTVALLSEVIVKFFDSGIKTSVDFTLGDLNIWRANV